jgi:hypothetical protein
MHTVKRFSPEICRNGERWPLPISLPQILAHLGFNVNSPPLAVVVTVASQLDRYFPLQPRRVKASHEHRLKRLK